ncbi:MAG: CPBP family intramembrane metalloprotease [Candidatus Omnitrophica bacterium]|nr:CPBP family intramembrane metalloprotease [Candidatus Omnitrophota bacterium]
MNLKRYDLTLKISRFIRREKLYVFLIIFTVLVSVSLISLNQFLVDAGMYKLLARDELAEEIISDQKIEGAIASNPGLYIVFLGIFALIVLFCLIGIILDIIYLYLAQTGDSLIERTQDPESAKWDLWDICKVIIVFFFAQRVLLLAEMLIFSAWPVLEGRDNLRLMLSATAVDIIVVSVVCYYVINERNQKVSALGLTPKRFITNLKYGALAYIGLMPILALVMFLSINLFKYFNIPIEPQPVLVMFKEETHIPTLIYMGFFTSILGPILEEVFFRGFMYGVFKKRAGALWGVILSALFFAYIHANLASFFPIICLGILLAYLYERTGSLIPSITVHAIHNSLSLAFLLFIRNIAG